MSKHIPPSFKLQAFTCPYCNIVSNMSWGGPGSQVTKIDNTGLSIYTAFCDYCSKASIWLSDGDKTNNTLNKMVYPDATGIVPPSDDMPEDVKKDYLEAASIYKKSPRASAALLRLATQKIFIELESKHNTVEDPKKKEHLDTIIKSFTDKGILDDTLNKVANSLRLTGNNAVHPGKLELNDLTEITSGLFEFINIIVDELIGRPKRIEAVYKKVKEKK